jgi:protein SCO1
LRLAAVIAGGLSLLTGCSPQPTTGEAQRGSTDHTSGSRYSGFILERPLVLSEATARAKFASSQGGSTTLGALQEGHLMLLYFGYTQCPDICPTTMVDVGSALEKVPAQIRAKVQVVFITTDPAGAATRAVIRRRS